MEYATYVLIYFFTLYFIINPTIHNKKYFFILWISISVMLSIIIRSKTDPTADTDLGHYARIMMADEIPFVFYREFVFNLGSRFLYKIIGDVKSVFILLDFITYILLFNGLLLIRRGFFSNVKRYNIYYVFFGILLFFPYVMGIHNILRQLIAVVFIMNAFGYIGNKKYLRGLTVFFISFFIHNAMFYFLPVLLLTMGKPMAKKLSVISLLFIVFFNSYITTSSNELLYRAFKLDEEGHNIILLYSYSLYGILLFLTIMEMHYKKVRKLLLVWIVLILNIIYLSALSSFSSGMAQRVAFLVLLFLYPILAFYIELVFKQKMLLRIVFFHLSILPLIFIHNTTIDLTPMFK